MTKRGTRKRRANRAGIGTMMRELTSTARPWYSGRWAGSALRRVPGVRSKTSRGATHRRRR